MKTAIKTLFASALTAIVLTSSAFTTFAKDTLPTHTLAIGNAVGFSKNADDFSKATAPVNFNKLVATGNVNIILVQGNREDVVSFDEINEANTKVTVKGYTLYINSNEDRPATIYVYVKDLQRIDIANTATLKTKGNFDLKVLQIFLKDNAIANVNAKVGSLYTDMQGQAALKMSGSSSEHQLAGKRNTKLDLRDFVILKS